PNRCIIIAAFEANRAERCKSVRYANTKAKVVTEQPPFLDHCSNSGAHIKRHHNGLERRVFHRDWIVEDHHHAIASKSFKRALFDDDLTDCRMIVAQERHHIFWIRTLRETCEAAQIAEQRGDFPPMAL